VFVTLDVVKGKDRAVTGRQLSYRFIQRYPVNNRHSVRIFRAFDDLYWRFTVICRLLHLDAALAEMHQDLVDGQAVQPCRKGGFAAEAANFSKELNEDFLCEVFCLRDIAGHAQAQRVDPTIMSLVKLLKGDHVALSRFLRQGVIGFRLRLGFGCGHVFVLGQGLAKFLTSPRLEQPHSRDCQIEVDRGHTAARPGLALKRGVMRRFWRVVALPNPKVIENHQTA